MKKTVIVLLFLCSYSFIYVMNFNSQTNLPSQSIPKSMELTIDEIILTKVDDIALYPFITGIGTYLDPFVIRDQIIVATDNDCIHFEDADGSLLSKYFQIRNNTFRVNPSFPITTWAIYCDVLNLDFVVFNNSITTNRFGMNIANGFYFGAHSSVDNIWDNNFHDLVTGIFVGDEISLSASIGLNQFYNCKYGVWLTNAFHSGSNSINNNIFVNNEVAITTVRCYVSFNTIYQCRYGVLAIGNEVYIESNTITQIVHDAIKIDNVNEITILNNVIQSCNNGIYTYYLGNDSYVHNNKIYDCSIGINIEYCNASSYFYENTFSLNAKDINWTSDSILYSFPMFSYNSKGNFYRELQFEYPNVVSIDNLNDTWDLAYPLIGYDFGTESNIILQDTFPLCNAIYFQRGINVSYIPSITLLNSSTEFQFNITFTDPLSFQFPNTFYPKYRIYIDNQLYFYENWTWDTQNSLMGFPSPSVYPHLWELGNHSMTFQFQTGINMLFNITLNINTVDQLPTTTTTITTTTTTTTTTTNNTENNGLNLYWIVSLVLIGGLGIFGIYYYQLSKKCTSKESNWTCQYNNKFKKVP